VPPPAAKPPATATTTAPAAPPPTPPKPAQIFSPEQERTYVKELDERLQRVRNVLARVVGRNLTPQQRDEVNAIRTFQMQAEQARESNLSTAVEFARRADSLATDLLGRLP
jgi:murein L,D-transpeptidase YcbB/YkuD